MLRRILDKMAARRGFRWAVRERQRNQSPACIVVALKIMGASDAFRDGAYAGLAAHRKLWNVHITGSGS